MTIHMMLPTIIIRNEEYCSLAVKAIESRFLKIFTLAHKAFPFCTSHKHK